MATFNDRTVDWRQSVSGRPQVLLINQTKLPAGYEIVSCADFREVAEAIKSMVVRGAPAIGAAAALGVALGAYGIESDNPDDFREQIEAISQTLAQTRPTAVNLFWAIERMQAAATAQASLAPFDIVRAREALKNEALSVLEEDERANRALGKLGAALLPFDAAVLTHCNAGALACVSYGTALGVIRAAVESGKRIKVFADETRPRLQGMKLTAWELMRDRIDVTVISDNSAGYLMSRGEIDCVIVGADRIAANGDTANKIGTYSLAVLADAHGIPFYVAAPFSTIDFATTSGERIPIEERDAAEVTIIGKSEVGPKGVKVVNYAFDVTPARLISAIVTERGVVPNPDKCSLGKLAR